MISLNVTFVHCVLLLHLHPLTLMSQSFCYCIHPLRFFLCQLLFFLYSKNVHLALFSTQVLAASFFPSHWFQKCIILLYAKDFYNSCLSVLVKTFPRVLCLCWSPLIVLSHPSWEFSDSPHAQQLVASWTLRVQSRSLWVQTLWIIVCCFDMGFLSVDSGIKFQPVFYGVMI